MRVDARVKNEAKGGHHLTAGDVPLCPLAISVFELKCYYVSDTFRLPPHPFPRSPLSSVSYVSCCPRRKCDSKWLLNEMDESRGG